MRYSLEQRQNFRCAVSGAGGLSLVSHLIPKRLGSEDVCNIISRFAGEDGVSSYAEDGVLDERLSILLRDRLATGANAYEVGFYHTEDDSYIVHNFRPDLIEELSIIGITCSDFSEVLKNPLK
ncbi:hypothetical protein CPB84DRAFT_1055103 [Gymnopilus junonius]|uniref:Uncharacterized protein n=1 Tax=Gymnopilus junonius TaxID=109634 RepID=A0A9P5NMG9_GYMJU|nr:hypothetical protein CPB84DRAFT_1055103 [Gymnopilus junonius]